MNDVDHSAASRLLPADWKSAELFFAHPNVPSYARAVEALVARGTRKMVLHPGGDQALRDTIAGLVGSLLGPEAIIPASDEPGVANIHFDTDADVCSAVLMRYIDRPALVVAARTAHHISNRPIFMVAVPKSGFHLVSRVLSDMGIAHGGRLAGTPKAQSWHTLLYDNPHLTCRTLFARLSEEDRGGAGSIVFQHPIVLCYRHPADIVVSEARYYAEQDSTPLAHYYGALSFDRRLKELIAENGMIGTLADRVGGYRQWLELPNVLPIAFEEIVGSAGGGSDALQLATLWSMQLKLHVSGQPGEFSRHLFGERNQTFRRGQIGGFRSVFKPEHYEAMETLENLEFLARFGYDLDLAAAADVLPSRSREFRHRPLRFTQESTDGSDRADSVTEILDETLYRWHGYHVGLVRGRFAAIEPGHPRFDPFRDETDARWFLAATPEALGRLLAASPLEDQPELLRCSEPAFEEVFRSPLVVHKINPDVNQFAVVRVGQRFVGTPHGYGEIDLGAIDPESIEGLIVGHDLDEVIARINAVPRPPRLVLGGYHHHNIVAYLGVYYGIPISAGAVDLMQAEDRDNPAIPRDTDLEALKTAIVARFVSDQDDGLPRLVRSDHYGFNLLYFRGAYHAIPQVAGAVDLLVRPPESIPGSRSAPTQEALEQRLVDDLVAPARPCPDFGSMPEGTDLASALRWSIERLEVQAGRMTRSEIDIGTLRAEVALLRRTLDRLLTPRDPPPPDQPRGVEET